MPWKFDLSDKMLTLYGFTGGLFASLFLTPRRFVVGITGTYLAAELVNPDVTHIQSVVNAFSAIDLILQE